MSADWKQMIADAADVTLNHPIVDGVIDEQLGNMGCGRGTLVHYGLSKIAHYAAQVSRAQTLGIDPELLRASNAEAAAVQADILARLVEAGIPVQVVTVDQGAEVTR